MRIGHSYDIHQLVEGRSLILGGVTIQHSKGLLGHSDADVLTHAIIESILGALALGDIGTLFPDTDPQYKDSDSLELLREVNTYLKNSPYTLGNIDATIYAEHPKMAPHIKLMRENIARVLNVRFEDINIKATRGERLGFIGREEGMAAEAVCLLL